MVGETVVLSSFAMAWSWLRQTFATAWSTEWSSAREAAPLRHRFQLDLGSSTGTLPISMYGRVVARTASTCRRTCGPAWGLGAQLGTADARLGALPDRPAGPGGGGGSNDPVLAQRTRDRPANGPAPGSGRNRTSHAETPPARRPRAGEN